MPSLPPCRALYDLHPHRTQASCSGEPSLSTRICNFNRHYAEYSGYYRSTSFLKEVSRDGPTVYYDSVTGKPLFVAPVGRSMSEFLAESEAHGWPSFRDQEVVSGLCYQWANCLPARLPT